jgi:uncharacterized protein (TIRG00374 family)
VLASVLLAPAGLWARARRWRYLFPPRSNPPGLVPAVMIGYMANNVLPLRAGEVVRVYVVARRWGHGFWTILGTLVVERVLDSLAIVLILALMIPFIAVPRIFQWAAGVLLAVDIVGIAVLVAMTAAPARVERIVARLARRWPRLEARALRILATFARGLEGIRTAAHIAPLLAWTVIVWTIPALAGWTALKALGLDLPFLAGWTVLAFVGLGVSIPSAPGYVGVFHAAAALAVGIFGVSQPAAVGFALIFHAAQYIPVTLLGWLYLLREHLTLGEAAVVAGSARPPAP